MDEVDAPKIQPWPAGAHHPDALPGKTLSARCGARPHVSAVEKQARTVDIEVDFDQPEAAGKLLVGYSADVEIILAGRDRFCACRPRPSRKAAGAAAQPGQRQAGGTPHQERPEQLGIHRDQRGAAGRRKSIVTSLDREGVKAGIKATADDKRARPGKRMALIELSAIERRFLLGDTTVNALAGLNLHIDAANTSP